MSDDNVLVLVEFEDENGTLLVKEVLPRGESITYPPPPYSRVCTHAQRQLIPLQGLVFRHSF